VVEEAELKQTDAGLVPASPGWFVLNARDARWFDKPGRGHSLPLTGSDEYEAETFFPMLGIAIAVLEPGEPNATYHWETEQEDFVVLSGEALLIVEGQERRLKQWDFVHCPPEARHALVGAGDGPCVILAASSRQFQKTAPGATTAPRRPPPATTRARPRTRRTANLHTPALRRRGRRATRTACFPATSLFRLVFGRRALRLYAVRKRGRHQPSRLRM
jgi:mannose-6-phosphate isomerase-like protein (cupin superfamily)